MVNHFRSFLLNEAASPTPTDPGEEHVPAAFRPRREINAALKVRRALFGSGADRAMKNYRLWQAAQMVHGSELAPLAVEADPRLTYWPRDPGERPFAGLLTVSAAEDVSVQGEAVGDYGPLLHSWQLTATATPSVQVVRLSPPAGFLDAAVTASGGRTTSFPLIGSGLRATMPSAAGTVRVVTAGVRPARDTARVLFDLDTALTDEDLANLFTGGETELALGGFWRDGREHGLRLGAACLAAALLTAKQPEA